MAKIAQQQLWGNVHDIHDGAESAVDSSIFPFFSSVCLYPVEWSENLENLMYVTVFVP
jgi:hypothetical protein